MSLSDLFVVHRRTANGKVVRLLQGKSDPKPKRTIKTEPNNYRCRVDPRLVTLTRAIRALGVDLQTNAGSTGLSKRCVIHYKHRYQEIPAPTDEDIRWAARFVAEYVISRRAGR